MKNNLSNTHSTSDSDTIIIDTVTVYGEKYDFKKSEAGISIKIDGKYKRVTNFSPKIEEEHEFQSVDGDDIIKRAALVAVQLKGKINRYRILYDVFVEFKWVEKYLGPDAEWNHKLLNKSLFLAIVKKLSRNHKKFVRIPKLGWHYYQGILVFLHAKGAISGNETDELPIAADVCDKLMQCCFPPVTKDENIVELINNVFELFNLSKSNDYIVLLGIAAVFRAPLNKFKQHSVVLMLVGATGLRKSAFGLILQAFFGKLFKTTLGNFESTAKAIELLVAQAGSLLALIDDYIKALENNETKKLLESMIGGVGNNTSRQFAVNSTQLADTPNIEAMLVMTGEAIPPLIESRLARCIFVLFEQNDIDNEILTICQNLAGEGIYAKVMRLYLIYIIENQDHIENYLNKQFMYYRDEAAKRLGESFHARAPSNIADFMLGLDMFVKFCFFHKVFNKAQAEQLKLDYFDKLIALANLQPVYYKTLDIKSILIIHLKSFFRENDFVIYKLNGTKFNESEKKPENFIGYRDDINQYFYIVSDRAHLIVDNLTKEVKKYLGNGEKEVWANMRANDLLVEYESNASKNVVRKTINGKTVRVYSLNYSIIGDKD